MIKYCIKHTHDQCFIMEIIVKQISLLEDYSIYNLKPGEYKYTITSPGSMNQDQIYSMYLYDTVEDALEQAKKDLTGGAERASWKNGTELDHQSLDLKVSAIQIKRL